MSVTWNPSDKSANVVLSNNDLTAGANNTAWKSVRATDAKSSGKWYFETVANFSSNVYTVTGVMASAHTLSTFIGNQSTGWGFNTDGRKFHNNSMQAYASAQTTGVVVMVAVDLDNSKIWWGSNGTWFNSGDPTAGTNAAYTNLSGTLFPACSPYSATETIVARFTQSSFSYTPPTGFSAWEPQIALPRMIPIIPHNSYQIARLGL